MKPLAAILIAGCCATPLFAEEVFRWTDDDGVVHFSQWMPNDIDGVTRFAMRRSLTDEYDPHEDPYSIRNQAERMRETWKKTEERREDREQRHEEAAERAARQPVIEYYPYYVPYPNYYIPPVIRPPIHHPIYPGYKHHDYPKSVQHRQLEGLQAFNRQPHLNVPYSPVTGVYQRATIYKPPSNTFPAH